MDNIKKIDELKKQYKDDPSYKDHPEMAHVGLEVENLIISHSELMAQPIEQLEFIIYPILPKAGYVLFHAESGIGKTYFCLNLAYITAQGGRFLKFAAPSPQKVLYVDAELGEKAIRRRMESINKAHGDLFFENIDYCCFDKFPNGNIPKIDTEAGREYYTREILRKGYKGIFLDNLLNLSSIDHNKANEWSPIQEWIKSLRKIGVFFFLVHHTSGDATKQLGTSARITIANTVISLQRLETDAKNKLKVEYQKIRDVPNAEDSQDFIAINNFDGSWGCEEIAPDIEKEIIYYWNKGLKQMQIFRAFKEDGIKIHHSKVYRIVEKLQGQGVLR